MRVLLRLERRRLLAAAALSAATSGCGIALLGCAAWLLGRAAEHPPASALALMAVAVRALGLGRGVSRYAERLTGHDAVLRVVADLRVAAFRAVARSRGDLPAGQALSAVVSDVDALQDLWLRCLIPFVAAALVISASAAACLWWSTAAALVLLAGLLLSLVIVPALAAFLARHEGDVAARRADYQGQILDVLQGCADLTVLGGLAEALDAADRSADALTALDRRAGFRSALLTAVAGLLQVATVLGVAAVALAAVRAGALPRVGLAVLVLVALGSFEPLAGLADAGALLPRTWGALRRLDRLLAAPLPETIQDVAGGGGIRLRGVAVDYGRGPVFRGVSLDLQAGRCLAVTGPSGVGKSTLLQVLAGARAPDEGTATVGGVDLSALDDEQRSRQVVLGEQQAYVFAASVRDNLRVARPEATDAQLMAALRTAGLEAWFTRLPRGWDTPLGERGSLVSGGERMRLSVARSLLSPAPVLLLDEPTEGLDPTAADMLLRHLIASNRHRAVVIVSHRTAALALADEVLLLTPAGLRRYGPVGPLTLDRERQGVRA